MKLVLSSRRLFAPLALLPLFFAVAYAASLVLQRWELASPATHRLRAMILRLFDLDRELNLPTWYSSVALLLCAVLLAVVASTERSRHGRHARHWAALSCIFLLLSIDEGASLHEGLGHALLGFIGPVSDYLKWFGVVPLLALAVAVAVAFARVLLELPLRERTLLLVSGTLYVGGAAGVEMLSAKQAALYGTRNPAYWSYILVEETLEMVGISLFLFTLVQLLESRGVDMTLQLGEPGGRTAPAAAPAAVPPARLGGVGVALAMAMAGACLVILRLGGRPPEVKPDLEIPALIEAEDLLVLAVEPPFPLHRQGTRRIHRGGWTRDSLMFGSPSGPGHAATWLLPPMATGTYQLEAYMARSFDYGVVQFSINGEAVGEPLDLYGSAIQPTGALALGTIDLDEGENTLTLEIVGRNPSNHAPHYNFGFDGIVLEPRG